MRALICGVDCQAMSYSRYLVNWPIISKLVMLPNIFKLFIIRTIMRALICEVDCQAMMYRSRVIAAN